MPDMGWWDRLLGRDVTRAAALPAGPEDLSGATVLYQSMTNERIEPIIPTTASLAASGYGGSSVVFSLISFRMLIFAEAEPRWWSKSARRFSEDVDGLDMLMHPWPGADHGEMQARVELDVSLAGNAFIVRPYGVDDRLLRLRPDWVTIQRIVKKDGRGRPYAEVDGYWYGSPESADDWVFYDVSEVAHYAPYPDPMADFRGMSWLTPVVREMTHDRAMTQYATEFFDHAATPNMIVKYTQNLGREKIREAQDMIRQRHGGMLNAYQAMVLDSGADVTIAGNSFEQMNFNSLRAATENRIASAAGVPPMLVGFKEGLQASTLANYDAAGRRVADMTMKPLWRILSTEMSSIVRPPRKVGREQSDLVLRYDATSVGALQQGAKDAAETFKVKALTAGELIRSGWDQKTVAEAVEAQDMLALRHTGKTPTALYDEEGNQTNGKPEGPPAPKVDDSEDGGRLKAGQNGGPKSKQGEGAAAPQPRSREEESVHPDDVRRLLVEQREGMIQAFRAGMEAVQPDDATRHLSGKHDQKSHSGKGGGSSSGGGEGKGGAGADGSEVGAAKYESKTTGTGTKDDPIRTNDPSVAAKALYDNQYVEFDQPRMVSTSLEKLKEMIDEAEARGDDTGKLNLCRASMSGSNLFCSENKGIPRVNMPQLSGKPKPGSKADKMEKNSKGEVNLGPAFREHLASKGIKITDDDVDASVLKATQNELESRKVLGIAGAMREGKVPEARIFVTKDDYVVDGHHRWAAKVTNEFVTGEPLSQAVQVIDAPILTVLAEANAFALDMGIPPASIGVTGRSAVESLVALEIGEGVLDWLHGR